MELKYDYQPVYDDDAKFNERKIETINGFKDMHDDENEEAEKEKRKQAANYLMEISDQETDTARIIQVLSLKSDGERKSDFAISHHFFLGCLNFHFWRV